MFGQKLPQLPAALCAGHGWSWDAMICCFTKSVARLHNDMGQYCYNGMIHELVAKETLEGWD